MDNIKTATRLSFLYDGQPFSDHEKATAMREEGGKYITEYTLPDGLVITNYFIEHPEFDACEWVTYFENKGANPSGILSALNDCDLTLPLGHAEPDRFTAFIPDRQTETSIYNPSGGENVKDAFYSDRDALTTGANRYANCIYPGQSRHYAASGGRSSNCEHAPFFNVSYQDKGYIFAIGWTGQWQCNITRHSDAITIQSGIEGTHFRLEPGEKIRTSSIVILSYTGDFAASQNKWRRLVKTYYSLIGSEGRDPVGPFCAGVWGGMTTAGILDRIRIIKENQLPFEYIWMDAGWYGGETVGASPDEFEGDWGAHTGDWRINGAHPDGLLEVTQAIRDAGMKFLLWFEPERVIYTTPTAVVHPEYFLTSGNEGDWNRLLNLGNEDAWTYCYDLLSDYIEKLGISCYRQDFNFEPLGYWRRNDAEDRQAITEIKHIMGLYRLWDRLLDRFPHLLIDNCASGGRRIDIETLRRSIPLWRSDAACAANYVTEINQAHGINYNTWMPYSGTSAGRAIRDTYTMRGAYAPCMTTNYTFSERDRFGDHPDQLDWIKRYGEEYRRVRPYLTADLYPLTESVSGNDAWCAAQYNRPENADGIVQVFKREKSPLIRAAFKLRGLDSSADYRITDADGGDVTVSGETLLTEGFEVEIRNSRVAKLYFYQKI